jgi:starch phosphorylase
VEAEALYNLLEHEIVPAFYERRADGLPRKWIARMKSSIATLCPEFNMHRMVKQYTNEYYLAAHQRFSELNLENGSKAIQLAEWLRRVEEAWPRLRIESVEESAAELELGSRLEVAARVYLDCLTCSDVTVEVVTGRMNADGELKEFVATAMGSCEPKPGGFYRFKCMVQPTARSGMYGCGVRVLPKHEHAQSRFLPGLILWAESGVAAGNSAQAVGTGAGI